MTPNSSPGGHRDHLGGATNEPSALTQRPAGSGRLRSAARGSAAASAARDAPCATWRSCLHRPEHPGLSPTTGHEPRALATQRTSHHAQSRLNSLDAQVFGTGTSSSTTERRSRRRGGCSASPIARPPTPPTACKIAANGPAEQKCAPVSSCLLERTTTTRRGARPGACRPRLRGVVRALSGLGRGRGRRPGAIPAVRPVCELGGLRGVRLASGSPERGERECELS